MKNLLFIDGDDAADGETEDLPALFADAARRDGLGFFRVATAFSLRNPADVLVAASKQNETFPETGGMAPLPGGGRLVVLATPLYWFGMSRFQKNLLNRLHNRLLPEAAGAGVPAAAGALLVCADRDDTPLFASLINVYKEYCAAHSLRDHGVLFAADLDALP